MTIRAGLALSLFLGWGASPVQAVSIDWADAVVPSGTVINPGSVLGAPDNLAANVCPGTPLGACSAGAPGSLTVSFSGSASTYGTNDLAKLLGVSSDLLLAADVIAFDRNPNPGVGPELLTGFEDSFWRFDDGVRAVDFYWDYPATQPQGLVSAVGLVDRFPYAEFFGLTPLPFDAGFGFLLFDLDGVGVDAGSSDFRVTISADPSSTAPDPDAIGRLVAVPEPAGLGLLLGLGCLLALRLRPRPGR